jgi:hypothetical protein
MVLQQYKCFVFEKYGELAYGLSKKDIKYKDSEHRYISKEVLEELVTNPYRTNEIVFIMRSDEFMEYISDLPVEPLLLVDDMKKDQIIFAIY